MVKIPPPPNLDNLEAKIPEDVSDSISMLIALSNDIVDSIDCPEVLPEFIEEMVEILGTLVVTYHGVQHEFAERSKHLLTACRNQSMKNATDEWAKVLSAGIKELPLCWETDLPAPKS